MTGTVILSHGYDSGPDAAKTTAMAHAAEQLGWCAMRPDYRAHDALGMEAAAEPRMRHLLELAQGVDGPLVLAGSSFGSFVSGLVSKQVDCVGLFLLAVPVVMDGKSVPFDLRPGIPTTLVHGHDDELCAPESVWQLARERRLELLMVPDGHRLAAHVDWVAARFVLFLQQFGEAA